MKKSDKLKRMIAFYSSVIIFFILLPIVLSYALGYHIDYKKFRIYKTGILYVNSQPSGASVYVNGKLFPVTTPSKIEELRPGIYRIEVKQGGFYTWEENLTVKPNMVTRADRIVLFPVTKEMKRVGDTVVSDFVVSPKNYIYFFTAGGLFRTGLDGNDPEMLTSYSGWPKKMMGRKFSPDGGKLLFFDEKMVGIVYLVTNGAVSNIDGQARVEEILNTSAPIINAFWYSTSDYVIVVTEKDIIAIELRGGLTRNVVSLYRFNSKPGTLYYDDGDDSLYFTDTLHSGFSEKGPYLYRLGLREKFFDSLKRMLTKKETEGSDEKK